MFGCVVFDNARVAEAINEVFRTKVVRVAQPNPEGDNANKNAAWVIFFSRLLSHGFMLNSRFNDGTACLTTIFIIL